MYPTDRRSPRPRLEFCIAVALAAAILWLTPFAMARDISPQVAYRCNAFDLNSRILELCSEHHPAAQVQFREAFHSWERVSGEQARIWAAGCAAQISEMPEDEARSTRAAMASWLTEFTSVMATRISVSPLSFCENWAAKLSTQQYDVGTPPKSQEQ